MEPTVILPAIVLPFVPDGQVSEGALAGHFRRLAEEDDVFCRGFVATVVVQQSEETPTPSQICESTVLGKDCLPLIRMSIKKEEALPAGPYFLRDSELRQARRLFPDEVDAFVAPLQRMVSDNGT